MIKDFDVKTETVEKNKNNANKDSIISKVFSYFSNE